MCSAFHSTINTVGAVLITLLCEVLLACMMHTSEYTGRTETCTATLSALPLLMTSVHCDTDHTTHKLH
jgi:hypothetical protein